MWKWIVACAWLLACGLSRPVWAERPPSIAGRWEVEIRAQGKTIAEHWTIQQKGAKITGTAKGTRGDMPVSGVMAGARFVVTVKDGDKVYNVLAMLDGDVMDGTVTSGAGEENTWHAKRSKRGQASP